MAKLKVFTRIGTIGRDIYTVITNREQIEIWKKNTERLRDFLHDRLTEKDDYDKNEEVTAHETTTRNRKKIK